LRDGFNLRTSKEAAQEEKV